MSAAVAAQQETAPAWKEKQASLRDIENIPYRTFNRIQGPRGQPPRNFYLSEYTGAYGSHPRMQAHWGTWGSLKTAGPYLKTHSPAYNPQLWMSSRAHGTAKAATDCGV